MVDIWDSCVSYLSQVADHCDSYVERYFGVVADVGVVADL